MSDPLSVVRQKDAFARLLGIEVLQAAGGCAKVRMEVRPEHLNGLGMVHGGAIFTLADYAFALACNSEGVTSVAINASISFVKAVTEGTLCAAATKAADGKVAPYEIRVTDSAGALVALFHGLAYRKTR